jgi:hypothetical protein
VHETDPGISKTTASMSISEAACDRMDKENKSSLPCGMRTHEAVSVNGVIIGRDVWKAMGEMLDSSTGAGLY